MTSATTRPDAESRVLEALLAFVANALPPGTEAAIDADTVLLGSGLLDSLGILQLVMYVADEFGVEVGDDDFTEENFATPGALARFVANRGGGAPG